MLLLLLLVLPPFTAMPMEDCNLLVADCIAISCCTQCLLLQIIIFVLLKLPCKLIRKTKEYAKKKLGRVRKEKKMMKIERAKGVKLHASSMSIELIRGLCGGEGHGCQCCMEEAEKVLEELSQKGEFAFGSFWGRSEWETWGVTSSSSSASQGYDFVQYELIEISSFSCS